VTRALGDRAARTHGHALGVHAGLAQLFLKARALEGRPQHPHAALGQGGVDRRQATRRIEPVIGRDGEGFRAVVDVEHDGVVGPPGGGEVLQDIAQQHLDTGVSEWLAGIVGERAAIPCDYRRQQFTDLHRNLKIFLQRKKCLKQELRLLTY